MTHQISDNGLSATMEEAINIPEPIALTLEGFLRSMIERGGSDLHISAGSVPRYRIDGNLIEIPNIEMLDQEVARKLIYSILDDQQIARLEHDRELDMSFGLQDVGRFRVNVCYQRGMVALAIRAIPNDTFSFNQLGGPKNVCVKLCGLNKGLVLVTGVTGSGKSTTLATMIDYCNQTRPDPEELKRLAHHEVA